MKILVLMSTYNGEKYIKEQMDSILSQKDVECYVLIRDDGSKDDTLQLLRTYDGNDRIRIITGKNCGYIRSFSILVEEASKMKGFDYFAFADQDDRWYPHKLFIAINRLTKENKDLPLLYCSNSEIINADGRLKGELFVKHPCQIRKGNILINTLTQGCSMVFNRNALILYAENPPVKTIHDRWLMMLCIFMGGKIIYDHTPLFAYRVHENNAIGVRKKSKGWNAIKNSFRYWFCDKKERPFYIMAKEFHKRMKDKLNENDLIILEKYVNYRKSIFHRIRFMFAKEYLPYTPTFKRILVQDVHILTNKV